MPSRPAAPAFDLGLLSATLTWRSTSLPANLVAATDALVDTYAVGAPAAVRRLVASERESRQPGLLDPLLVLAVLNPTRFALVGADRYELLAAALGSTRQSVGRATLDTNGALATAVVRLVAEQANLAVDDIIDADPCVATSALRPALDSLALAAPLAHDLVGLLSRRIVARTTRSGGSPVVWSTPLVPGAVTVVDIERADRGEIVEDLVHETIHTMLYLAMFAVRPFRDAANDRTIRSPWTDNPLQLRTYVHACFVWFGIAQLWRRSEARLTFGDDVSTRRAARAARGFRCSRHLRGLGASFEDLTAPWQAALLEISDIEAGRAPAGASAL